MTSLDFPDISPLSGRVGPASPAELPASDDTTGEWNTGGAWFTMDSEGSAAHDPTLLAEALAEIEARRAALEWLLQADLLRLCLV